MRSIACFAFLLTACATVPPTPPVPALQSASAAVRSWGVTLHEWNVDAAGHVEHKSGQKVGGDRTDVMIETRRFTLTAPQQTQLAAAVTRVESILATPEGCDERLTDGPYGTFTWDRGGKPNKLDFDGNCVRGRNYELVSAIFAADGLVDAIAKTLQPVERHPLAAN